MIDDTRPEHQERLSDDILRGCLADARRRVPYGSFWRHALGAVYQAKGAALNEATHEPVILYERHGILWTRPLVDFERRFTPL